MKELPPINPSPPIILPPVAYTEQVREIVAGLDKATDAAFGLLRELTKTQREGDEWTRMPRPDQRCPVSSFSRSKIDRLVKAEKIRSKMIEGGSFYSLSDVRAFLRATSVNPKE